MSNILNLNPVLKYCDKKLSYTGTCSSLATNKVKLLSKNSKVTDGYRCDKHIQTATVNKNVFESEPFNQSDILFKINTFLKSLINKEIFTSFNKEIVTVKYLKDNGGVMCQTKHGKWKYVYYHQINLIANE